MKNKHVVVVVLTCSQKEYTLTCLESLKKQNYTDYSVVVVDNNSKDDTATTIQERYPEALLVLNDYNAGVAGGRNCGIAYARQQLDYSYLLILDNDTTVEPDFLYLLVKEMEKDTTLGAVSPKIYLMDTDNILDQAGGSVVNFYTGSTAKRGFDEKDTGQYDRKQTQKCLPSGACTLARESVLKQVGDLDEIFNPYGFEDLDFSLRVLKAGFRLRYVPAAVVYHKGNKTGFDSYTESYANIKGKHLKTFMHRHANGFQLCCFYALLPLLALRTLGREIAKGNGKAVFHLAISYLGLKK